MESKKYFHKCGHPILEVKRAVGPAVSNCFVDGNQPVIQGKDGGQALNEITKCPECGGTIKVERLLTRRPDQPKDKMTSGYIPVKM
jgi:RNA polymerase-binding transcription factor DksA